MYGIWRSGPASRLIVVSVCRSSTSGSASSASSTSAAPAARSGRSSPASGVPGAIECSPMTITRLAPNASAGLIGAFRRVPPSKCQPSSSRTAGNKRRDRGRGAHVGLGQRRGHVVDPALVVAHLVGRPARVEDDAAARARGQRHDRRGDQLLVGDVLGDGRERDRALQGPAERAGVQQRRDVEREQAGEVHGAAGEPLEVLQRGRGGARRPTPGSPTRRARRRGSGRRRPGRVAAT